MNVEKRFLSYIEYETASSESTGTTPSTENQRVFAVELKNELSDMGINARVDENGYVYAVIDASEGCENACAVGFIAHMDTSPEFSDKDVKAQIIKDYDGSDITLGNSGRVIKNADFPHLRSLKGRTLITTDGTTLLGADDKAGVAEIMTLCEKLVKENIPHGKICIAFTPDEEIGEGADRFDVEGFGADFAYTVDGGQEGGVEYENFNASCADIVIKGFSVHPGSAKNTMINAALVGMEFNSMLPSSDTPRDTEGYEGFYHLTEMSGDVNEARLSYIIRDHSSEGYNSRNECLRHIAKILNEKYGEGTVSLSIKEQYRNMAEKIADYMHIVENAVEATKMAGVTPYISPIRGGTDGARLSFMGLPCPNLGTGGYAFHGPYEHISVEGMNKVLEILLNIVKIYSSWSK